ncbi:acyltransferase family protein [Brenneria izbisi]|uniref:Acyltransferase n=1 Tax=Brenneria izbisi TaxID=2939450 RepID=A0AA42C6I1_9GAMM|nr:acyltransferase family protein [Brenneria izbisi]MCV9880299.1 acyltransferase [Brenneria izbisi]MCV9883685.1 acyltransferase [Brenneria izbisi]
MTIKIKEFRNDINGLRAWAVIFVVLYHFNITGFSGGFIGVDVFFVISGFLMTKIIVSGFEKESFSFILFYLSRLIRILPALFSLCIFLLIIGWFWLPSIDYNNLSTHSLSAILFLSNIKFWREAGYFDAESHEKWLLHTWSLSVEMQFYIILPIMVLFLWKMGGKKAAILGLIFFSIISLLVSYYASPKWPTAAFFLFPARAWEMLAGGLTWFFSRRKKLTWHFELIGFSLIFYSVFFFDTYLDWPGLSALVPVLGCVLVLFSDRKNSILTGNFIAQTLGNWSYSLYLWHWPVVVFLSYGGFLSSHIYVLLGIITSIVLGATSYFLIEVPTRRALSNKSLVVKIAYSLSFVMMASLLSIVAIYQKYEGRINKDLELVASSSNDKNPNGEKCLAASGIKTDISNCILGKGDLKAIVLGDSHADAIVNSVVDSFNGNGSVLELAYAGCPTLIGAKRDGHDCEGFNKYAIEIISKIQQDIPVIIINRSSMYALGTLKGENPASLYGKPAVYFSKKYDSVTKESREEYISSIIHTSCEISKNRKVYLTTPVPEMNFDIPKKLSHDLMFNREIVDIFIEISDYHERNKDVIYAQNIARNNCGVEILDVTKYLCENNKCYGNKGTDVFYFDDDHLSELGNRKLSPMFSGALSR